MTRSTIIDSHDCAQAFPAAFIQMLEFILFFVAAEFNYSVAHNQTGSRKKAFSAFSSFLSFD